MIGKILNYKKYKTLLITMFCCFLFTGCSYNNSFKGTSSDYKRLSKDDSGNTKYKGHYKVGEKYKVKDKVYKPREVKNYTQVGIASWYGTKHGFHGSKTANGDKYNKNMLTAAHRTLQLPSLVEVTNLENNKSVIVLVNDRGPYTKGRIIDLSEKAAELIDMKSKGTAKVKIKYLHSESSKFLSVLGLEKKHGSLPKSKLVNKYCTVNCHIKLVNLKHKIKVDKGSAIKRT